MYYFHHLVSAHIHIQNTCMNGFWHSAQYNHIYGRAQSILYLTPDCPVHCFNILIWCLCVELHRHGRPFTQVGLISPFVYDGQIKHLLFLLLCRRHRWSSHYFCCILRSFIRWFIYLFLCAHVHVSYKMYITHIHMLLLYGSCECVYNTLVTVVLS